MVGVLGSTYFSIFGFPLITLLAFDIGTINVISLAPWRQLCQFFRCGYQIESDRIKSK